MRILNSIVLVAALLGTLAQGEEKRELLSRHETVAVFAGAPYKKCLGLTALCPDKCDGSGEVATFEIRGYLVYEQRSPSGAPRQNQFTVRISDYNKKPLGNPARRAILDSLKPGDFVLLSWQHEYVTSDGSSFPVRPVTLLKKISAAEAAELLKQAAPVAAPPSTLKPDPRVMPR